MHGPPTTPLPQLPQLLKPPSIEYATAVVVPAKDSSATVSTKPSIDQSTIIPSEHAAAIMPPPPSKQSPNTEQAQKPSVTPPDHATASATAPRQFPPLKAIMPPPNPQLK
ncbi:hypothetical protein BDR22DRAFT_867750 [Usnea florida]